MAFDVHAGDKTGDIEVAAEREVIVTGMAGGIGLSAGSGALISLAAVAAEIIDAAVDQPLDAHPVGPALDVRDGADAHGRGNAGEAGYAGRAGAIGAGIAQHNRQCRHSR